MSSSSVCFTSVETSKPTSKDSKDDATVHVAFHLDVGSTVYHRNPIGLNYVFKNKKGTITGFVNETKKRAIIKWSNGQVKKHNVSSLTSSPHKESCEPSKKRKRTAQTYEKVERHSSLVPIARQNSLQSEYIDEKSDSDSDSDSDDEWVTKLLLKI